ncbi:hypothetical protein K431DRAFT_282841 [Polychaeton citri CBS 116435]|uniref:Uncharacterized protein n=1 Tax=Polychaeton citri CBS 116435 TaxID=1314669 RepID=A0A9P4QAR9_9PEZI|nr:hypothetical protein K431DRAFT_282841 [Polychaeton citri CBS 116435]
MSFSDAPLLRPMAGLCLWTFAMEVWLYSKRIPAIIKYDVKFPPNSLPSDIKSKLPRHIEWPAENFTNLHEQPTVFYAVCLALTQIGVKDSFAVNLAWAYVGIRVGHSIVQAKFNNVLLRLQLFLLSGVTLATLTTKLALNVF